MKGKPSKPLEQLAMFDVPAVRVEASETKSKKKCMDILDVSRMGIVAISYGKCLTFKTIADSFGNKLR